MRSAVGHGGSMISKILLKITKISRTWVFQSKMVSDTPTVTVENSDSRVCQVGVTSSHVAYTKDV